MEIMASRVMSLVLVISVGYLCSSQAYTFHVGGDKGWTLHPSHISYNRWAEMNRFQINDTLVFKYKDGSDSVLVVTKDDYERCNKDSPLQVFKDGNSEFKFNKSGPFFFISGRTRHCEMGQKLVTVVLSDRHHNAPPSPSHSPPMIPPPSSHSSPPPHPSSGPSPPPTPYPPPSPHHAPAPTPNALPPDSNISAPPSEPPQSSPTRSPAPKNPPSDSPSPSPDHQAAPTPIVAPTPPPASYSPPLSTPEEAPSPSAFAQPPPPEAESPKNEEGAAPQPDVENQHPDPSSHATSPAYPHHSPAPAPSAAPAFGVSYSQLVGILCLSISLLALFDWSHI